MSEELVVQESAEIAPVTLFGTDDPVGVMERAAKVAQTLEGLLRKQDLVVRIGQSDHVRVEGWTLLGSMLGVFPVVEWTRPVMEGDTRIGWEARVEARTRHGETVGAAESECLRSERSWRGREDYALKSMAQTRAVSKALRLPLGFVMQIAGFSPTPAEEMPRSSELPRGTVIDGDGVIVGEDDGKFPPVEPIENWQVQKLNRLVGTLRTAGHITTAQVYAAVTTMRQAQMRYVPPSGIAATLDGAIDEDGVLHWKPLCDTLTKDEASSLIDRLERLAGTVNVAGPGPSPDHSETDHGPTDGQQAAPADGDPGAAPGPSPAAQAFGDTVAADVAALKASTFVPPNGKYSADGKEGPKNLGQILEVNPGWFGWALGRPDCPAEVKAFAQVYVS